MNTRPQAAPTREPTRAPTPEAVGSAQPARPSAPRRWSSSELLGTTHEAEIRHGDAVYRLRLTSQGKLILTK